MNTKHFVAKNWNWTEVDGDNRVSGFLPKTNSKQNFIDQGEIDKFVHR